MSVKYQVIHNNKGNYYGKTALLCYTIISLIGLYSLLSVIGTSDHRYLVDKNFVIDFDNTNQQTVYSVIKFNRIIHQVHLNDDFGKNFSVNEIENGIVAHGIGQEIKFETVENSENFTLIKVSRTLNASQVVCDCFELFLGKLNWYGGTERVQEWPIEKSEYENFAYLPTYGVAERYWLHSQGGFIYVDEQAPLFVSQNVRLSKKLCFKVQNSLPYNTRRDKFDFIYYVGMASDAKQAQVKAIEKFLNKPNDVVDRRMIEHPIWSTWARYKKNISETVVQSFATEIQNHGFNNSQIEIDDYWETCYGSMTFDTNKFPNISNLVSSLKSKGFRVTLWSHPFINKDCEPWYTEAKNKGYLVTSYNGSTDTQWWDSEQNGAGAIDYTKLEAAEWFVQRLQNLKTETGVDSFKFDSGDILPPDPNLNASIAYDPMSYTKAYIRTVALFGPSVEVRVVQGAQDLPIFLRFGDKNSNWFLDSGLSSMLPTLFILNIDGYSLILPDMIGGNGYNDELPSKELFIRWLQLSTFMPSLQFSYVPWDYDNETIEICKTFTSLHFQYADVIMQAIQNTVATGEPVNPPIWWIDPNDKVALACNDEYLLGDSILVAPVTWPGAIKRNVYLPRGIWYDPNQHVTHQGPTYLRDYPAPLHILPYFIRMVSY